MSAIPTIDTENPEISFVNLILKIGTDEYTIESVTYDDNVTRSMKMGNSPIPLGMTEGEYKAAASLVMFRSDFQKILAKQKDKFYSTSFTVVVQYAYPGTDTKQDELVGCRWKKRDGGGKQGADPLKVQAELDVLYIKWEGDNPWPKMPTGRNN